MQTNKSVVENMIHNNRNDESKHHRWENRGKYMETVLGLVVASAVSFLFLLKSPLHPWINGTILTDSSVFKTVAMMMDKGKMPYVDSFDHKGPLVYIINWAGNQISSYRGVWVIEFVFMITMLWFLYKTARIVTGRLQSVIAVLVSISLLFSYFDAGNLVEEYAMAFIAVAQYVFVDYFIHDRINIIRLLACGFGFGAVLMLRPNMIALWVVMCIFVLIGIIKDKNYARLGGFLLWFMVGALILITPILIWLAGREAVGQFLCDYIWFNKEYSNATFVERWKAFFVFMNTKAYILSFVILTILCRKEPRKKAFHTAYLVYMVISLLLVSISGREFPHYGMILVPVITYPIAAGLGVMDKCEQSDLMKVLKSVVVIFLASVVLPGWCEVIGNVPYQCIHRNDEREYGVPETIASYVSENVAEEESISVYGNWDIIYVLSDRKHATRYSYQFPVGIVKPTLMDEYFEQLKQEKPRIIVVQGGYNDGRIQTFLVEHQYELVWGEDADNEEISSRGSVYQLSE